MIGVDKAILRKITEPLADVLNQFQFIINVLLGFALGFLVFILVFQIFKFSKSGDNPNARSEAKKGILIVSVCVSILGSLWTIYALFLFFMFG